MDIKVLLAFAASGSLALQSFPATPAITRIEPSVAVPGGVTTLTLRGDNLDGSLGLWASFPCAVSAAGRPGEPVFSLKLGKDVPQGLGAIRLITTNGLSNPQLVLIDRIPAITAAPTNRSLATARQITTPCACAGVCEDLRSDFYRIRARKGQRLPIEVVAQRTGSPLDPFLRLLDDHGLELAATDDTPGLGADARLEFRCPKTGDYFIEVRDTRYAGGPGHAYLLRLGHPLPAPLPFLAGPDLARCSVASVASAPAAVPEREPNDAPAQAQRVTVPVVVAGSFGQPGDRDLYEFHVDQGDRLLFNGSTRSLASPCDLFLRLETTNGTKIAEADAHSADEGRLTNRFEQAGVYRLTVEELNRRGGPELFYRLAIQRLRPGFALSMATERVSVPAGDSFEIEVQAQRRDYDGPIRLALIGSTDRLVITNALIPARTNSTKLKVTVAADSALGDFLLFGITGTAVGGETNFSATSSTLPALRNIFPAMSYPPPELDGSIALSIAETKSATPAVPQKKRKP